MCAVEQALDCDIICVHTPYTTAGPHPTHHLIGAKQLRHMRPGAILLNAGRGGAIDSRALLAHLQADADLRVVLDVWENEPEIDLALLELVALGSPHIAGYSYEGKLNGSAMIHAALAQFLEVDLAEATQECEELMRRLQGEPTPITCDSLNQAILATYDINADDERLRRALTEAGRGGVGTAFDRLRKTYPERREFSHYRALGADAHLQEQLHAIGFAAP